ncbi:glycosyltransferase involved in cell wall biosynthesis [Microbacterium laevaniformans]|nr:glycosyltransferase involved in cell wall biosynthesis [Microbacterium laevaniformans]
MDDLDDPATREVVERIAANSIERVKYVASLTLAGSASRSRNVGLAMVETPLVAFLDDDDEWLPGFLASTAARLGAGVDLAVSHTVLRTSLGDRPFMRLSEGLLWTMCLGNNPGLTGSNFVAQTAQLIALDGFDETLLVAEDQDLLVRYLAQGGHYRVLSEDCVIQHAGSGEHLSSPGARQVEGLRSFLDKYRDVSSIRDRRYLRAMWHAASIYPGVSRRARVYHRIMQLMNLPLDVFIGRVAARLRNEPSSDAYK